MKFNLDISTHDRRLGFDIAGVGNSLSAGTVVAVPGGAKIELLGMLGYRSVGIPETLQFIVEAAANVELSLFATWLYEKVKSKKVTQISINRRVITEITEDGIRQVLEEELEKHG